MTQPDQPVQAPSLESFFSGGGGKTLSWKGVPIGTVYTGIIKAVGAPQHATDPATQKPAFTRQGKPRMQVRIDLATEYRDPQDPDDDGSRSIFVGGWMTGAIGDAMRKAGVNNTPPQVGATLSVRLIEREDNGPSVAPTNKFDAHYIPPSPAAGFFDAPPNGMAPLGGPAPQQAPNPGQFGGQVPTPSMQPGGGYVQPQQQPAMQQQFPPQGQMPPVSQQTAYQQPAAPQMQQPQQPVQQQAAPQQEPPKPPALAQAAWDAMPLDTKIAVATTMGAVPGAQLNSPEPPPF